MGAVGSVLANMEPLHPDIVQHKPMFQRLGFSSWGANGMRKLFCAIDEDHSGEISIREFLKYFDLDRTKFSKRAFAIFDADSSGELDFKELTMSIWNYCTLTTMTLMTRPTPTRRAQRGGLWARHAQRLRAPRTPR